MVLFVLFPALAPILGAWLTVQFGWRMNFLFLTFFAIFGLVITLLFFKETRPADSYYQGHILDLRRFMPIISTPIFLFNSLLCMVSNVGNTGVRNTCAGLVNYSLRRYSC